jgi:hypothetical protein
LLRSEHQYLQSKLDQPKDRFAFSNAFTIFNGIFTLSSENYEAYGLPAVDEFDLTRSSSSSDISLRGESHCGAAPLDRDLAGEIDLSRSSSVIEIPLGGEGQPVDGPTSFFEVSYDSDLSSKDDYDSDPSDSVRPRAHNVARLSDDNDYGYDYNFSDDEYADVLAKITNDDISDVDSLNGDYPDSPQIFSGQIGSSGQVSFGARLGSSTASPLSTKSTTSPSVVAKRANGLWISPPLSKTNPAPSGQPDQVDELP